MNPLLKSSLDIKAIELLEIPTEDKNDIKAEDWKKIIVDIRSKFLNISPYVICATKRKEFVAVS